MLTDAKAPSTIRYLEVTNCPKCGRHHDSLPFVPATDNNGSRVWESRCPNAFGATPLIIQDDVPVAFVYPMPLSPFDSKTTSNREYISGERLG